jgi:hypothetical protein
MALSHSFQTISNNLMNIEKTYAKVKAFHSNKNKEEIYADVKTSKQNKTKVQV